MRLEFKKQQTDGNGHPQRKRELVDNITKLTDELKHKKQPA